MLDPTEQAQSRRCPLGFQEHRRTVCRGLPWRGTWAASWDGTCRWQVHWFSKFRRAAPALSLAHRKMQSPSLASFKRQLGELQQDDAQNKENRKSKRGLHFRQLKLFATYRLPVGMHYLSACLLSFLPKEPTRLPILKNYCFNDSMGKEHKIFMILLPKIEAYSLIFQRNCLQNQREKRFSRVCIFGLFFLFIVCLFSEHICNFRGYYKNLCIVK